MEAYLLHDANAGSNLKLMIMIQEEGMKGYGIYWTVLEFLRLQNEYKASLKVIPILAQKARVTTATLKRIIYDYALFEVNETSFSSPGLSRRMEPWDAQQVQRKYARSEPLPPYSWHGARGLLCMASATSWVPLSQEIRIPGHTSM